jgi:hypothetical protein
MPSASALSTTPSASVANREATVTADQDQSNQYNILNPQFKKIALFHARLPQIVFDVGYAEMWGVFLQPQNHSHVPTRIVLAKFLKANDDDLEKAEKQFRKTLEWRRQKDPRHLLQIAHSKNKFQDLGYVTQHTGLDGIRRVVTWNVYGVVTDKNLTFGDMEEYVVLQCCNGGKKLTNSQDSLTGVWL